MDGYKLAEQVFINIGNDPDHEISLQDLIQVISFWGFNEEAPVTGKIGFVCRCARNKIKQIFEKALVYDNYSSLDTLIEEIYSQATSKNKMVNRISKVKMGEEPCDDVISRSDAIKVVNDMLLGELNCKEEALKKMKRLQSVQPEQRKGKWIYDGDQIICNRCKTAFTFISLKTGTNYCANCGASMEVYDADID